MNERWYPERVDVANGEHKLRLYEGATPSFLLIPFSFLWTILIWTENGRAE
jgi:hypothetical protein